MPEKYNNVKRERKKLFINNLVGGIAWGLGATIGLAFLIALLGLLGKYVDFVPFVGNFVSDVISFVLEKNSSL